MYISSFRSVPFHVLPSSMQLRSAISEIPQPALDSQLYLAPFWASLKEFSLIFFRCLPQKRLYSVHFFIFFIYCCCNVFMETNIQCMSWHFSISFSSFADRFEIHTIKSKLHTHTLSIIEMRNYFSRCSQRQCCFAYSFK